MSVYKRGDVWYIYYYLPGGKGKKRVREAAGESRKVAEQLLAKRKAEILAGKYGIEKPQTLTFQELTEKYFESATRIKPMTMKRYKVSLNQLMPYFGDKIIDKITAYEIEQYQQKRLKARAAGTVNRDLAFMWRLFNVARKWKLITSNPLEEIDFPREDNIRTRFFSIEEVERLLEQCLPISYLFLGVEIALNTGMRKGEIMSLRIPQDGEDLDKVNWIDIKNRCLHLNITKSSKYRQVPINDELLKLLEKEMQDKEPGRLFKYKDLRYCFATAMKRAGIKNGIFHDLRRTFISHAMMAGYSREVIQKVVGQEDPRIFERYAHLAPDLKKQVVNDVGRIFGSRTQEPEGSKPEIKSTSHKSATSEIAKPYLINI